MKVVPVVASMLMLVTGSALAQTDKDKQPGGNVPVAQGPCSAGYENSVKNGRMALGSNTMRQVDTNDDGLVSRDEFNAACANKLFKDQESRS